MRIGLVWEQNSHTAEDDPSLLYRLAAQSLRAFEKLQGLEHMCHSAWSRLKLHVFMRYTLQAEAAKLYAEKVLPSMVDRHDSGGSRAARAAKQRMAATVNSKAAPAIRKLLETAFGVGGTKLRKMDAKYDHTSCCRDVLPPALSALKALCVVESSPVWSCVNDIEQSSNGNILIKGGPTIKAVSDALPTGCWSSVEHTLDNQIVQAETPEAPAAHASHDEGSK